MTITQNELWEPAFPVRAESGEEYSGMSLRDYFAAKMMQGILAGPASRDGANVAEWFDAVLLAYQLADAMLIARRQA